MSINHARATHGIFSAFSDKEASKLIEFFLYYAADKKASPLSLDFDSSLTDKQKTRLADDLCGLLQIPKGSFIFDSFLQHRDNEIKTLGLDDQTKKMDSCGGFFHILNQTRGRSGETQFACIVRHLRNSIAHGRIEMVSDDLVLLEDMGNKILTMRLVLPQKALLDWAELIQAEFD